MKTYLQKTHFADVETLAYIANLEHQLIVRTYNGESAEEYGLMADSMVHYWTGGEIGWTHSFFQDLDEGDIWMKQPNKPNE